MRVNFSKNYLINFFAAFVGMSVAKAYGVVYKHHIALHDIVDRLGKLFPKCSDDQQKHQSFDFLKDLRIRTSVFIVLNISGIWAYNLTPLITQLYGIIIEGKSFEKKLPTHMWLWFDPYQPGIYESMYAFISWLGFTMSVTILATDLLFCSILTLLSMQFKILSQDIRDIDASEGEDAFKKLKNQVKIHQELIDLSEMIEEIFSPSLLMNVMTSSMVICLTGFSAFVSLVNISKTSQ